MKQIVHYDATRLGVLHYWFELNTLEAANHFHLTKLMGDITLIDRTNTLGTALKIKSQYPIPALKSVDTMDNIGMQRAVDIINKANSENKKIRVMWSGGLDSTAALCWLLNCGVTINDLEIALNEHSIKEYPIFYHNVLTRLPLKLVEVPRYVLDISDDTYLITGEHGDQLFGSTVIKKFNNGRVKPYGYHEYEYEHNIHAMKLPYYPLFQMLFMDASGDINGAARIQDYLQPLIDVAPFKLKTVFDLTWWVNFTQKWQEVAYRMTTSCPTKHNNHIGFYSSDEFQLWAMDEKNHLENKIDWNVPDPWNQSYKKELRECIFKYTDDLYYRNTKPKVDSLLHHNLINMCFRYEDGTYDSFGTVVTGGEKYKQLYFNA